MESILILLRLILAGVFALAAVAKLADRAGSTRAIIEFGLPSAFGRPLGLLIPLAELAVVFLLVGPQSVLWGGVGALALLIAFSIAIGANLILGRTPDCHCFGQLHSAPVGWPTLLRNMVLAACAVFAIWQGRRSPGSSVVQAANDLLRNHMVAGGLTAVVVFAVAAQSWVVFRLFRQHGRMLMRIDTLEASLKENGLFTADAAQAQPSIPIGSPAPSFELPLLSGEIASLESLCESRNPVLLIFTDPGCNPCNAMMPDIARWERNHADKLTVALISRGSVEMNRAKAGRYDFGRILLQRDREVAERYYAAGTPSAILINSDGLIESAMAMGPQAIGHLVAQVTDLISQDSEPLSASNGHHRSAQGPLPVHNGLKMGEQVPSFQLPDVEGNTFELDDLRGHNTLLLFWNPNCGFCSSMLPDLKAWERDRASGSPELVVISSGTAESNRAMQLRSLLLLDSRFSVGAAFGVTGTPSAVLVDSNGSVASTVAVGAAAVLNLAAAAPRVSDRHVAV